mgnify:CR=1 FL=1
MNSNIKTAIFWVVLICVAVLLWAVVRTGNTRKEQSLTFTQFLTEVENGRVKQVTITGSEVKGSFRDDNTALRTLIPSNYPDIYKTMREKGVNVEIKDANTSGWVSMLVNFVPFVLLFAFWIFMMRQMQSGGNKALSFGKSRARLHSSQQKKVTFKDVAGVEEAKEELQEIIEFLREPQKFQKLGGRIPKGVLLIGPPGTGKTLLARAIAGEANVPFFSISGSDFVEMFVGVGASRVRDLFEQGKKNAPCIIFIDEIDAVGRHRGAGLGGGHDEREQTLNQLLVEMDGFESNEGVILVAATNRPDVLDPALLRPGRFDRRVVVARPDVKGREQILKVHTKKTPMADDVDLSVLARGTPGFAGADLANLVNEAALAAARQNRKVVTMYDFEVAKDKVIMGVERKSLIISEEEKRNTAYHEAGHALVARLLPDTDPVHKISILPRGMALGYTLQVPLEDKYMTTKTELLDNICVLLGGRVAEELVFGRDNITTGAANDLEKVKKIARKMVCEFGMSENLGPVTFGDKEENVFLGRALAEGRDYSEDIAFQIDQEIRKIVDRCYKKTEKLLKDNYDRLTLVTDKLLEKECLDGVLLEALLDGKDLPQEEIDRIEAERKVERERQRLREIEEDRVRREGGKDGDAESGAEELKSAVQTLDAESAEGEPELKIAAASEDATDAAVPDFMRGIQSMDGLMARFQGMLLDTFNREYRPRLSDAECGGAFRQADEQFFREQNYNSAVESLQASIRECRDRGLMPGLRILLGLAYFRQGNIERLADELMAALMAAPSGLEKNVERLLVSAISYFRILNEEIKKNNLTMGRLPEEPDAVRTVESRYREWEKRTGYHISVDTSS